MCTVYSLNIIDNFLLVTISFLSRPFPSSPFVPTSVVPTVNSLLRPYLFLPNFVYVSFFRKVFKTVYLLSLEKLHGYSGHVDRSEKNVYSHTFNIEHHSKFIYSNETNFFIWTYRVKVGFFFWEVICNKIT